MKRTYTVIVTPFYKRKKLIQTKEVEKWFYDVIDQNGAPWGRYNTPDAALKKVQYLEDCDKAYHFLRSHEFNRPDGSE